MKIEHILKFNMLVHIPSQLKMRGHSPTDIQYLETFLGKVPFLIFVIPNAVFIEALVSTWDPECSIFRFGQCEMTPTLEEISGLLGIPFLDDSEMNKNETSLRTKSMACLVVGIKIAFSKVSSLSKISIPGGEEASSIDLEFLYSGFGSKDSYYKHASVLKSKNTFGDSVRSKSLE